MINPQVIVFDMDGTLLNEENQVCAQTKEMLDQLSKQKILMIATGRTLKEVEEVLDIRYFHHLICSNGMAVYDNRKNPLRIISLSPDLVVDVLQQAGERKLFYEAHNEQGERFIRAEDFFYMKESVQGEVPPEVKVSEWKSRQEAIDKLEKVSQQEYGRVFKDIVKVYFFSSNLTKIKAWNEWLIQKRRTTPFALSSSSPNNCEINSFGISKGEALEHVLKDLNMEPHHVLAFGDGINDKELFQLVGWKVAMLNAVPELKKIADDITAETNQHAAVAKYIRKHVLGR